MFNQIFQSIGFAVCHQIPSRTFSQGGDFLPVCARCSGLYIGFFLSLLFLLITSKKRSQYPSAGLMLVTVAFLLLLILDGIISTFRLSYFCLKLDSNSWRFLTGLLGGYSLPVFSIPLFNFFFYREHLESPILENPLEKLSFFILPFLFFSFFSQFFTFLFSFFKVLISLSVIFTFVFLNFLILLFFPIWCKKQEKFLQAILPLAITFFLTFLELFLFFHLHLFLTQLTI